MTADPAPRGADRRPMLLAGLALGIGLGGFVDGILFHQILQWHGMLSHRLRLDTLVNVKVNMFWDGIFHAFTWTMTAVGVALLWRCGRRAGASWSGRVLAAALLMGWGAFNLCEGVIDHHLLHLHQVYEHPTATAWDYSFLVVAAALVAAGWLLARARGHRNPPAPPGRPFSGQRLASP